MEKITFEQFIKTFNFRNYAGYNQAFKEDIFDTYIIRIYLPKPNEKNNWFEFGVYDMGSKYNTWDICKKIFNKEILKSYIDCIQYNKLDCELAIEVFLTEEKEMELD